MDDHIESLVVPVAMVVLAVVRRLVGRRATQREAGSYGKQAPARSCRCPAGGAARVLVVVIAGGAVGREEGA